MSEPASRAQPWLRRMSGRDPGEAHRGSTPLELLFDLTFAVAVAQAAAQLEHALAEQHAAHAVAGYAVVFFGLWWAWVTFTWFASAYDTDDVVYRLLTLLQMAGVLVFAAVAAPGAGLQVAVGSLDHTARVTPPFAAFTVAIPVTTFIVVLGLLNIRGSSEPAGIGLTLLAAVLILATAAATPILTLPSSIVIMVVLVALLLAYHLTAAHRAAR